MVTHLFQISSQPATPNHHVEGLGRVSDTPPYNFESTLPSCPRNLDEKLPRWWRCCKVRGLDEGVMNTLNWGGEWRTGRYLD